MTVMALLASCQPSEAEKAQLLMTQIEQLRKEKKYKEVLDSIRSLRAKYPQAVEARRRALTIWQDASLKLTQADIATTDSALQSVLAEIRQKASPIIPTRLRIRRDSLQIRYDALCATARTIYKKQKE